GDCSRGCGRPPAAARSLHRKRSNSSALLPNLRPVTLENFSAFWAAHLSIPASLIASAAIALLVLVAGLVAYRLGVCALRRFTQATQTSLDDILVRRMRVPARVLVVLLSAHAFLTMRGNEYATVRTVVVVLELFIGAYLAIEIAETLIIYYWL